MSDHNEHAARVKAAVRDVQSALQALAAVDDDDFCRAFLLMLLRNAAAAGCAGGVGEGEMDRLYRWADGVRFEAALLELIFGGYVAAQDDGGERRFTLTPAGVAAGKRLEEEGGAT